MMALANYLRPERDYTIAEMCRESGYQVPMALDQIKNSGEIQATGRFRTCATTDYPAMTYRLTERVTA